MTDFVQLFILVHGRISKKQIKGEIISFHLKVFNRGRSVKMDYSKCSCCKILNFIKL